MSSLNSTFIFGSQSLSDCVSIVTGGWTPHHSRFENCKPQTHQHTRHALCCTVPKVRWTSRGELWSKLLSTPTKPLKLRVFIYSQAQLTTLRAPRPELVVCLVLDMVFMVIWLKFEFDNPILGKKTNKQKKQFHVIHFKTISLHLCFLLPELEAAAARDKRWDATPEWIHQIYVVSVFASRAYDGTAMYLT